MTVADVLRVAVTRSIWITSEEDPNDQEPELILSPNSGNPRDWLSDEVLDSEVYLMAAKDNVIYVSLFLDRPKYQNEKGDY